MKHNNKKQENSKMEAKRTEEIRSKAAEFIIPQDYSNPLEDISDLPITTTKKMKKTVYFRVKDGEGFTPLTLMTLPDPRDMEENAFIVHPKIVESLAEVADQISISWCHLIITRDGEKKILYLPAITDLNKGSAMLVHRARIIEEAKSKWFLPAHHVHDTEATDRRTTGRHCAACSGQQRWWQFSNTRWWKGGGGLIWVLNRKDGINPMVGGTVSLKTTTHPAIFLFCQGVTQQQKLLVHDVNRPQ